MLRARPQRLATAAHGRWPPPWTPAGQRPRRRDTAAACGSSCGGGREGRRRLVVGCSTVGWHSADACTSSTVPDAVADETPLPAAVHCHRLFAWQAATAPLRRSSARAERFRPWRTLFAPHPPPRRAGSQRRPQHASQPACGLRAARQRRAQRAVAWPAAARAAAGSEPPRPPEWQSRGWLRRRPMREWERRRTTTAPPHHLPMAPHPPQSHLGTAHAWWWPSLSWRAAAAPAAASEAASAPPRLVTSRLPERRPR